MVTVLGFAITVVGCCYIGYGLLFRGTLIVAVGMIFDSLDGSVAKVTGKLTKAGAFLDSMLDRVADSVLMLAVALYGTGRNFGFGGPTTVVAGYGVPAYFGPGFAVLGLVLGLLISYVRARAESLGFECKVGLMERAPRAIIVILGLFFEGLGFHSLIPSLVLLVVLSSGTLVHRFVHVWKQARTA